MGCMMKKCKKCQVMICDPVKICPLCHSVLEASENKEITKKGSPPRMYPDVKDTLRIMEFVVKIYVFLAIIVQVSLMVINYITFSGIWWSWITGIGILYFYLTLKYSIQKNAGYQKIILNQIIGGVFVTIGIDWIIGYRGWSVNFVVPSAILLIDLAIVILMIVNTRNWQSYILMQMLTVILSGIILVLWKIGVIQYPVVTIVAAVVSVVMFVGTLIFGDRRAKNELKRRFHM